MANGDIDPMTEKEIQRVQRLAKDALMKLKSGVRSREGREKRRVELENKLLELMAQKREWMRENLDVRKVRMTWGKYQGRKLSWIPTSYLQWARIKCWQEIARFKIELEMERRDNRCWLYAWFWEWLDL
jgi:hypothetical protein